MTLATGCKPINLLSGWPNPSLLPPSSLLEASQAVLADTAISSPALGYGPDEGYQPLRHEIAGWLTDFYRPKDPISPKRICISGGASQNLSCILQTFTDPVYTRAVFMVAPTYFLACRIFEDSGFAGRMKAVPEDAEGVNIDFLARKLRAAEDEALSVGNTSPKIKPARRWSKIYKYVIYAVPTFANPSGRIMSLARRQQLVRLARQYDALIVTDDVYDMLQWSASPAVQSPWLDRAYLPRIVDVDRYLDGGPADDFGHAASNGSFSKIIGPGCRTGWTEGTEKFAWGVSQTGSSRSGGCPSQLVAALIHQMIVRGTLARHIQQELRPAYARRYQTLLQAINDHLIPLGLTVPPRNTDVAGGYFIWLTLPEPLTSPAIAQHALERENLTIMTGPKFQVHGDQDHEAGQFERDLRLCFAWEEEELLPEGVERLARVIRSQLEEARS